MANGNSKNNKPDKTVLKSLSECCFALNSEPCYVDAKDGKY